MVLIKNAVPQMHLNLSIYVWARAIKKSNIASFPAGSYLKEGAAHTKEIFTFVLLCTLSFHVFALWGCHTFYVHLNSKWKQCLRLQVSIMSASALCVNLPQKCVTKLPQQISVLILAVLPLSAFKQAQYPWTFHKPKRAPNWTTSCSSTHAQAPPP